MTQIVFVHGVATRHGGDYQDAVEARDRRFLDVAFGGTQAEIANPYWGKFGTDTGALKSIPDMNAAFVALGGIGGSKPGAKSATALLDAARKDFAAVVGALSVSAISLAEQSGSAEDLEKTERLAAGAAAFAVAVEQPAWLHQIADDDDFLARLTEEAKASQHDKAVPLGLLDGFQDAADNLAGGLSNLVNGPIAKAGREILTPKIAVFIGDVFHYLKGPASGRDDIRKAVLEPIIRAAKKDEKVILIGHSMGGVILFDLLSDPKTLEVIGAKTGKPFRADLLVTVGSQVGLFAEMQLYESSKKDALLPLAPPVGAALWWNVFDKMDILFFVAEPVFSGVSDFSVDTTAGIADAHGAYFSSMMFYTRLNRRLIDAGLI